MPEDLLTEAESAPVLRVKPATLRQWRWQGRGPKFRKHGRKVFYTRKELERWSARQEVASTSRADGDRAA